MIKWYRFVEWFGCQQGVQDTDDLEEAKKLAIVLVQSDRQTGWLRWKNKHPSLHLLVWRT